MNTRRHAVVTITLAIMFATSVSFANELDCPEGAFVPMHAGVLSVPDDTDKKKVKLNQRDCKVMLRYVMPQAEGGKPLLKVYTTLPHGTAFTTQLLDQHTTLTCSDGKLVKTEGV